jgi:hypothetical protein
MRLARLDQTLDIDRRGSSTVGMLRVLPLSVIIALAASCSSSKGNPDHVDGSADGTSPPKKDSGHPGDAPSGDVGMSSGDGSSDGPSDAGEAGHASEAGDAGSDSGVNCHEVGGDGSTLYCSSFSGASAGPECAMTGHVSGPCPSTNLTGCCVFSTGNAICFYSSDSTPASEEQSMCTSGGDTWVTTAPP